MNPSIIGSIIEATATLLGILVAALIARHELKATREQIRLATYENVVSGERQLVGLQMQDDEATEALLQHFKIENVPEDPAERRFLLGALLQIQVYESMFYRHIKGFFPDDLWDEWDRSMANSFKSEAFKKIWKHSEMNEYFWKPFVDYVNREYFHKRV